METVHNSSAPQRHTQNWWSQIQHFTTPCPSSGFGEHLPAYRLPPPLPLNNPYFHHHNHHHSHPHPHPQHGHQYAPVIPPLQSPISPVGISASATAAAAHAGVTGAFGRASAMRHTGHEAKGDGRREIGGNGAYIQPISISPTKSIFDDRDPSDEDQDEDETDNVRERDREASSESEDSDSTDEQVIQGSHNHGYRSERQQGATMTRQNKRKRLVGSSRAISAPGDRTYHQGRIQYSDDEEDGEGEEELEDASARTYSGNITTPVQQTYPGVGRKGVKRKMKYQRTRSGCLCCRKRRVKCDEGKPICRRCKVGQRQCEYGPEDMPLPRAPKTPTPTKAKSTPRALPASRVKHPQLDDDEYVPSSTRKRPGSGSLKRKRSSPNNGRKAAVPVRKSSSSNVTDSPVVYGHVTTFDHGHSSSWHSTFNSVSSNVPTTVTPTSTVPAHHRRHSAPEKAKVASPASAKGDSSSGTKAPQTALPTTSKEDQATSGMVGGQPFFGPIEAEQTLRANVDTSVIPGVSAQSTGLFGDVGGQIATIEDQHLAEEIATQQRIASQGGAPLLTGPDYLEPWFPEPHERALIMHYSLNASTLLMAIPSSTNPVLFINLPLALQHPKGTNLSCDALRIALLGTGAIHQAFLRSRSGVNTPQTAEMFQYASRLREIGKDMVRRAALSQEGAGSDGALGAATALASIDIFFGGNGWKENFTLAKEMVKFRGGPNEMLKTSKPRILPNGETLSPARMMLEILAIYETFGCLTTGEAPTLLSDQWEDWWSECRSTYQRYSVEQQFGMSRVMIRLFSRLTRLLSRLGKHNVKLQGPAGALPLKGSASVETTHHKFTSPPSQPGMPSSSSSSTLSAPSSTHTETGQLDKETGRMPGVRQNAADVDDGGPSVDLLGFEADQLNADVDAWIEKLKYSFGDHDRIQVGNKAYAYAMKILLLRRVFNVSPSDDRIQEAAREVLQHCSWSTAVLNMAIDLVWPAIIAACSLSGGDDPPKNREWQLSLLEGFKPQCCFDIDTTNKIIQESWRRTDAGEERSDWKEVCDDLNLKVLEFECVVIDCVEAWFL